MPITCPLQIRPISQAEFGRLDFEMTRLAFECHNELGRLCDEEIYQNDLRFCAEKAGLKAVKEVPIVVSHQDFAKIYSIDLLVSDAAVYELKTASAIVPEHEGQLLNYMLLVAAPNGKVINFRTSRVQCRFVNATVTPDERRRFKLDVTRWHELGDRSRASRMFFWRC